MGIFSGVPPKHLRQTRRRHCRNGDAFAILRLAPGSMMQDLLPKLGSSVRYPPERPSLAKNQQPIDLETQIMLMRPLLELAPWADQIPVQDRSQRHRTGDFDILLDEALFLANGMAAPGAALGQRRTCHLGKAPCLRHVYRFFRLNDDALPCHSRSARAALWNGWSAMPLRLGPCCSKLIALRKTPGA